MIDEARRALVGPLVRGTTGAGPVGSAIRDLALLDVSELVELRDAIGELLPSTDKMDLHTELAVQYAMVKQFQKDVLSNDDVPANQVAQCMNTTVATLGQLIKMQESLERQETLKVMEGCLIEAVSLLSDEAKVKFFEEYEALASNKGLV